MRAVTSKLALITLLTLAVSAGCGGGGLSESDTRAADLATVMSAVDLADSAGFHDMAEDLAEASEINPRYASRVGNVLAVLQVAAWPEGLASAAALLEEELGSLGSALEANDLVSAQAAAEEVHDAQHDLSVASYTWLTGH